MLIQKMILFLDEIRVLQSRKLRNQILNTLNLTKIMFITHQNNEKNSIKKQSEKQKFSI